MAGDRAETQCAIDGDFEQLYSRIGKILVDEKQPMKERFRSLFTLRNLGGLEAIYWISEGFKDPSALLKHECAYCLGQMGDKRAVDILISVLEDLAQEPMVRHEAGTQELQVFRQILTVLFVGEALGAIADDRALPVLERYENDDSPEVAETCQLALQRLRWMKTNPANLNMLTSRFLSVDPTPCSNETRIEVLEKQLLDDSTPLFDRYRAMFSLRNIASDEAVRALAKGLRSGGALFRHEVAYVLGQIQSAVAVQELADGLADESQNPMVRHECADALGSIADDYGTKVLQRYLKDPERVVRESCEVGLDIAHYEKSGDFQYANYVDKATEIKLI